MTDERGILSGISVSHTDASLDQLETVPAQDQQTTVQALLEEPGVTEAFSLQTCNRVEAYVVTSTKRDGKDALATLTDTVDTTVVRELGHEESLKHLLRVAAGLESLVLGEDQILGQLRDAYEQARAVDGIGPILDAGITKAIHVGERARTETAINEGVVSLASAAVRLAEETHGLAGTRGLVIGAGEMGTVAAKRLAGRVDQLVLANRTLSRAESLADTVDAPSTAVETASIDQLVEHVSQADIVISATASEEWILSPRACSELGETFIVDITRPRDIPPAADENPQLTVYDLDELEAVTEKTRQMRKDAASQVEAMIDEEFERLLVQYKRKRADSVISAMYESAERVKAAELETTFEKLDLDEESEAVIESMADTIVSQLLAPPTNSLRDAAQEDDWSTIHTALQLFDPNFNDEAASKPDFVPDDATIEDIPPEVRSQLPASAFEESD